MRKRQTISRAAALSGVPHKAPAVKTEQKSEKLYVTVQFERPKWQRLLGADSRCERTFGMDVYGREVYDSCDGQRCFMDITKRFAKNHRISVPEAETAVAAFMTTLMTKGLVVMAVGRTSSN